jgi:carboxyl-terminal processing protease
VFTEGLGTKPFQGRISLLLNEHSASAAEMVAAFAAEYRLATLVGTKTAGRLVAATAIKVGHGYRVALPVAAYFTWKGASIEGTGVTPDVPVPMDVEALWNARDNQLEEAAARLETAS